VERDRRGPFSIGTERHSADPPVVLGERQHFSTRLIRLRDHGAGLLTTANPAITTNMKAQRVYRLPAFIMTTPGLLRLTCVGTSSIRAAPFGEGKDLMRKLKGARNAPFVRDTDKGRQASDDRKYVPCARERMPNEFEGSIQFRNWRPWLRPRLECFPEFPPSRSRGRRRARGRRLFDRNGPRRRTRRSGESGRNC
jgi:hypothetical protein